MLLLLALSAGCALIGPGCEVERQVRVSCDIEHGGSVIIIPQGGL